MEEESCTYQDWLPTCRATEAWIPNVSKLRQSIEKRDEILQLSQKLKDFNSVKTQSFDFRNALPRTRLPFRTRPSCAQSLEKVFASRDEDFSTMKDSSQRRTLRVDPAAGVKTGDDVVEFYARFGQDSPVKFFYCNREASFVAYMPYELVVTSKEKICKTEYFTMSATGVMHIKKDAQAEFSPLSDWVHEKTMFGLLRKLKFYKHFFAAGCFSHWLKILRQSKFKKLRKVVSKQLFFAMDTFCGPLMKLHSSVHKLETINFCPGVPNHVYHLEEFIELYRESRDQFIKPAVESIIESLQQGLESVCMEVEKTAQIYRDSIRDESELFDRTGVELFQGRRGVKNRSMMEIKQEKIDRANAYYRVMREEKLLGRFIRLIDTIFVEKLVNRGLESMQSFLELLNQSSTVSVKSQKGIFQTALLLMTGGRTIFSPDVNRIQASVKEELMEGLCISMQKAPRILFARGFGRYFENKPTGLNTLEVLNKSESFHFLKQSITTVIDQDFEEAEHYASAFEEYKKIQEFGEKWNVEDYAQTAHLGIRDIRRNIHKQKEWRNDIDKMKLFQVVGCLSIETKTLRSRLLPVTESILEQLKTLLMELAQQRCTALLKDFIQYTEDIKARPNSLEDFTEYMSLHTYHVGCKKGYLKAAVEVDDMYELLFMNEKKISATDQVRYDDLKEAVANFIEALKLGKEFIADHKHTQIEKLQINIQSTNEDLVETYKSLNKGVFVDVENTPSEVVSRLEEIMKDLDQIKDRIETLKTFQQLFELPPDDFHGLERTQNVARTRFEIWNTLEVISKRKETWLNTTILNPQTNVVCLNYNDEIHKEIMEISNTVLRLRKENKEDRVVFRLKDKLDEVQSLVPILEFAFNPLITSEEWKKILLYLDKHQSLIDANGAILKPFSIQDLLRLDILDKINIIQSFVCQDSKEHNQEEL